MPTAVALVLVASACSTSYRDAHIRQVRDTVSTGWTVDRVIDGDTVEVSRRTPVGGAGDRVVVRLIGIDAPESVDPSEPVECYARQSSSFAKRVLLGKPVSLEFDPSQGRIDKYGRTLAYVWLPKKDVMFNRLTISTGHALEYTYDSPYQWRTAFLQAQRSAHRQRLGEWKCPHPGS
jgi:micrococcal nuclease